MTSEEKARSLAKYFDWDIPSEQHSEVLKALREEREKSVVYNVTDHPIVITTRWSADPMGGPAVHITDYMIRPGEGIDLSITGLAKAKEAE